MNLSGQTESDTLIVIVHEPRIDAAVAIQFKDRMRSMTDSWAGRVLLDLHNVQFIDSSGLGAVVAAKKQLGPGRSLDLAGLTPNVAKVFALTRMDRVFVIHADRDAAVAPPADAS